MILLFEVISDEGIFTTTKSTLYKRGREILKYPIRHIKNDIEINIAEIDDEEEFMIKRDNMINYGDIISEIIRSNSYIDEKVCFI